MGNVGHSTCAQAGGKSDVHDNMSEDDLAGEHPLTPHGIGALA